MKKNTKSAVINSGAYFRLLDLVAMLLFLGIAAFSVNLFRKDLVQTINLRNEDPVGTVLIRKNIVQRRLNDRVIWDRLAVESNVYIGDLIRVAELSSATLSIDGNNIVLNENTLIRITRAPDERSLQIILDEGDIQLASEEDSRVISLEISGVRVQAVSGTVLNASVTEVGMTVQVQEGAVQLIDEEQEREIHAGTQIALDVHGVEREEKAIVVTHPLSNALFLNGSAEAFSVNFFWNRLNFLEDELLRLEIAADRNFNNIAQTVENLDGRAQVNLMNGQWHWRLSHDGVVLGASQFTVKDGSGPELRSPAVSSIFRYTDELPEVNFQWSHDSEVMHYILEVSSSSDFTSPQIRRQGSSSFYTEQGLGPGTWYWRVMPVFPSVYVGASSFSQASFFTVEQIQTEPEVIEVSLTEWLVTEAPPQIVIPEPVIVPPELRLTAPRQNARIEGLTALRQQTVFTWECDAEITRSRFVLSRNADPFRGRPVVEINNPGRRVTVNSLNAGTWYWNVEIQTADGFTVMAAEHGVLQVAAIPLLPVPQNMQPARGRVFTMSDLQTQRSIDFSWQAVRGANAYILTISQQIAGGNRQILRTGLLTPTSYVLDDLRILDQGTFIWQVEAVNTGAGGSIDQRGNVGSGSFVMDIVLPTPIQIEGALQIQIEGALTNEN